MAKYKIEYDRKGCIGATVCCIVCPKFWKMAADGKADLIGSKRMNNNDLQILEIEEKDMQCNKDAAEACPVNVIHIINLDNGEKLI